MNTATIMNRRLKCVSINLFENSGLPLVLIKELTS